MAKPITYEKLAVALGKLNFQKIDGANFTAFENNFQDALIVLPKGTPHTIVSPAHVVGIERIVEGKGITSVAVLRRMINGLRHAPTPRATRVKRVLSDRKHAPIRPTGAAKTAPAHRLKPRLASPTGK